MDRSLGELRRLCPAAVIFDLEVIQPEFLLSLFQKPGLLLVGINTETHQALVWSGRQAAAVESSDLVSVIQADFIQKKDPNSELIRTVTQILGKDGS